MGGHTRSRRFPDGFTLIELLAVIAILAILAGLSIPALTALSKSGQINQTVSDLTGTLDLARQTAIAQNTYVWVAFAAPDPTVPERLDVAILSSADGTEVLVPNTTTWGGTVGTGSPLNLVSRIKTYPLTRLAKAGTVTATPPPASVGTDLTSTSAFSLLIPGNSAATIFNQAVEFTPSGEARVTSGTQVNGVEFDLQPCKAPGVVDTKNGAVFQISGLVGNVRVYRQ